MPIVLNILCLLFHNGGVRRASVSTGTTVVSPGILQGILQGQAPRAPAF